MNHPSFEFYISFVYVRGLPQQRRRPQRSQAHSRFRLISVLDGRGLSSNIAVPTVVVHSTSVLPGSQRPEQPNEFPDTVLATCRVIIGDADDAERLARIHVRKEPNFGGFMDSVISTTDNQHWMEQRGQLSEAFLPLSSLAKILPVYTRKHACIRPRTERAHAQHGTRTPTRTRTHTAQLYIRLHARWHATVARYGSDGLKRVANRCRSRLRGPSAVPRGWMRGSRRVPSADFFLASRR